MSIFGLQTMSETLPHHYTLEEERFARLRSLFPLVAPDGVSFSSLRAQSRRQEQLSLRRGVLEPPSLQLDSGVMVTVYAAGGVGYAATSAEDERSLANAFSRAEEIARWSGARQLFDSAELPRPQPRGIRRGRATGRV